MNTIKNKYAIYYKDFNLLYQQMLYVFLIQAILMFLVPVIHVSLLGSKMPLSQQFEDMDDWFPTLQIALNILLALIAAAHCWAEERMGKTDQLLLRIPIPRTQLVKEKVGAGLSIVLAAFVIQIVWFFVSESLGFNVWGIDSQGVWLVLIWLPLLAYIIGLPLSYYIPQTLGVVLTGIAYLFMLSWNPVLTGLLTIGLIAFYSIKTIPRIIKPYFLTILCSLLALFFLLNFILSRDNHLFSTSHFQIFLVFGLLAVLAYFGNLFPSPETGNYFSFSQYVNLIKKQNREHLFYLILSIILFAMSFYVLDFSPAVTMITVSCLLFLLLIIGISTYTQNEKDGLNNVLFHHPISLHSIFWCKYLFGLFLSVIPAVALAVLVMTYLNGINLTGNQLSPNNQTYILKNLVNTPYLVVSLALVLYACAALFTHCIQSHLYCLLVTLAAVVGPHLVFCYLELVPVTNLLIFTTYLSGIEFDRIITKVPLMLFTGLTAAAWRTATDRSLLTTTTVKRFAYVSRLYFFVLAATVLLVKVGWFDLLYLITGIDAGMG